MSRPAAALPARPALSDLRPTISAGSIRAMLAVGLVAMFVLAAGVAWWKWGRSPLRVANSTTRLPWSVPAETPWTTVDAYPSLRFFEPTCVAYADDGTGRVLVLERRGTVRMFRDDPSADQSVQVLDLSSIVWRTPYEDDGAVGMVLHPEFGKTDSSHQGEFFLLYTAKVGETRYNRLSRCVLVGETATETELLIDQLNENLWHNGGGLAFGPDGFLYVGMGDEGTNGDGLANGQRLDRDLYCGILRLDVDRIGGDVSHPIVRQPESGRTTGYYIPNDNPFVGRPGTLEEFWAHGLRNPFRIAFDPLDGRLWAADVGHLRREEVNVIVKGGNYGWSYREGSLPFDESWLKGKRPEGIPGEEIDPIWEYPHLNGNNCIIGGFVYRGGRHQSLEGKFLCADNGSGRVWALRPTEDGHVTNEELLALPVSSKTGIASVQADADGEPLLVILGEHDTTDGSIRRLVPAERTAASSFPTRLSETGIFADLASLTVADSFVAYDVAAPQRQGESRSRRWISVPGDGHDPDGAVDRIGFDEERPWEFPAGTIFVQHFELPTNESGDGAWRRVETRVLVRHHGRGVYGLSYRWNDDQQDAQLVTTPQTARYPVESPEGSATERTWQFFDRQACLSCHNPNAGFVLGVNMAQLLGAEGGARRLADLERRGYFRQPLPTDVASRIELPVDPRDESLPLDRRVRSLLATECSACHREGGARANFYAELHGTAEIAELAIAPLQGDFGIADARLIAPGDPHRSVLYYRLAKLGQGRMPFVGAHELDEELLALVRRWITELDPNVDQPTYRRAVDVLSIDAETDRHEQLDRLTTETGGSFAVWQAVLDGSLDDSRRRETIERMLAQGSPAARDLFEWFVAQEERTQRLGTDFDPSTVLMLAGDASRGAALFADTQQLSCANCHSVSPGTPSVGPSLVEIGGRLSRNELLDQIVRPSMKIAPEYRTSTVMLIDGSSLQGMIREQTEERVVLVDANGKTHELATDEIEQIESSDLSLMPENLLQGLTPQQAADLLEFLANAASTPATTPSAPND